MALGLVTQLVCILTMRKAEELIMQVFSYSVSRRQDQILISFLILVIIGSILICVSLARSTGIVIPRMVMFSFF